MKKTHVINDNTLRMLLAKQRQDIRIGVVDRETAMAILGLGEKDFYKEVNSPDSKIVRSKKKGRFIYSSIILEFKRIHGVSYHDATNVKESA
ncbi:hypothetical protein [Flagellimonas marina]|uniref:DNA-binding protein n=1 Tax=Flagellimonas marina TaxID=1775168 RepID=A0ABV8PJ19_9FLAO